MRGGQDENDRKGRTDDELEHGGLSPIGVILVGPDRFRKFAG
jgi:hypothetical protein